MIDVSHHLVGRVAKNAFGTFVPAGNDAVEILPNYRIVRRVYNRRQSAR
jgi:hypothetical protein